MNNSTNNIAPRAPELIGDFEPGSRDTALSARRANKIIRAANAIWKMRAKGSIKLLQSDAGLYLELLIPNPPPTIGSDDLNIIGSADDPTVGGAPPPLA